MAPGNDLTALTAAARRAWPRVAWSEARVAELLGGAGVAAPDPSTQPESAQPERTQPESTQPESTQPESTQPERPSAARVAVAGVAGTEMQESHDELFLAWACLLGDADALRALEARYIADVVPNLDRLGLSAAERDEALQALRARLLLPTEGGPPGLGRYAGRGHLGGFVRTTAVRLALDLRRARSASARDEMGALLELTARDPELEYMRRLYAGKVEAALQAAWGKLTGEQRLLVRQQALDGLGIDQLATLHSVHRSTAARRCVAARAALVAHMRRELRAELGAGGKTVESILHLFSSGLEAHLREAAG